MNLETIGVACPHCQENVYYLLLDGQPHPGHFEALLFDARYRPIRVRSEPILIDTATVERLDKLGSDGRLEIEVHHQQLRCEGCEVDLQQSVIVTHLDSNETTSLLKLRSAAARG